MNFLLQIREWGNHGKKNYMCTARPGWQTVCFRRPKYKSTFTKIEVNLIDILEVDVEKKVNIQTEIVTFGNYFQE